MTAAVPVPDTLEVCVEVMVTDGVFVTAAVFVVVFVMVRVRVLVIVSEGVAVISPVPETEAV